MNHGLLQLHPEIIYSQLKIQRIAPKHLVYIAIYCVLGWVEDGFRCSLHFCETSHLTASKRIGQYRDHMRRTDWRARLFTVISFFRFR